jgi:hypothetical protein
VARNDSDCCSTWLSSVLMNVLPWMCVVSELTNYHIAPASCNGYPE